MKRRDRGKGKEEGGLLSLFSGQDVDFDPNGQSGQHLSGQSGQLTQWSDQWDQHVSDQSGQLIQTEESAGLGLKKAPGLDLNTCALKIDHMLDIHSTSSKNPTLYTWCLPYTFHINCILLWPNKKCTREEIRFKLKMWTNSITPQPDIGNDGPSSTAA